MTFFAYLQCRRKVLPVLAAILLFPVVGCCRNHLGKFCQLAVVGKYNYNDTYS